MTEREIFIAALNEQDPAERRAFLDRVCGEDAEVHARVEALLAAHDGLGSFLEGPADPQETGPVEPTVAPSHMIAPEETAGVSIGPYKLLEIIGEGGMGTVWMADQARPIRRRVAVKVIKAGMDSRQVVARFEAERQALALMDHPNIAKVLDAGSTASGRPYFVMELVRGVPLTKFCDDRHLDATERLRIFQQVCSAVQHAHQKGVIHRDLKPTNVLVESHDGWPVPKVIDFGLAKAVGAASLTDRSLFTHFGTVLGTPLYMAPEQAEFGSLDVDTRADVYALGVLLYELLTGTTPIERGRLAKAAWDEICRVLKEEEPPAPSARLSSSETRASVAALRQTEPAKLGRFVRGDLDWVVMKALAKERERRYESASAFAADVERFLNHEPVSAGPPTATYRLRKFVRRNKAALTVAGLVLFFLVLIGSGAGWVFRDRAARQAATEQEAGLACQEAEDLLRHGRYADALSSAKRAEAILANGGEGLLPRVGELQKDARMAIRLDDMQVSGDGKEGTADRASRYALAFQEYGIDADVLEPQEVAERVATRIIRNELVMALDTWALDRKYSDIQPNGRSNGRWKRLIAAARAADGDEVRNKVRDALEVRNVLMQRQALIDLAPLSEIQRLPLQTLDLICTALSRGFEVDPDFFRAVQRQHPGNFSINFKLANLLDQRDDAQYEEAIRYYTAALASRPQNRFVQLHLSRVLVGAGHLEEAIAWYRRIVETDPTNVQAWTELGQALTRQGKPGEAIPYFKKAIELEPKGLSSHLNLGWALVKHGKPEEAIDWYRKAIELPPKSASDYDRLGYALSHLRKYDEATACYRKAIDLAPKFERYHLHLASALFEQRKYDEAIDCYYKAIELGGKSAVNQPNLWKALVEQRMFDKVMACYRKAIELEPKVAGHHNLLGRALAQQKMFEEAITCYRTAIELEPKVSQYHHNLGFALVQQRMFDEAITCYRKAIELNPGSAYRHQVLGNTLGDQGKLEEAIACYKKAIELDPKDAGRHNSLGVTLRKQKKLDEAIACYKKAIELDPNNAPAFHNLGNVFSDQGKLNEAIACYQKAVELNPKGYSTFHHNLGLALAKQGKLDEAIACFQKVIELDPKILVAHFNLGNTLVKKGKFDEAIACHKRGIALLPEYSMAHNNLAWLLATCPDAKLRDPALAVVVAKKAVELGPKNPIFPRTLGTAYYRTGEWKAAITALEKSLELRNSGDSFEWFFLAMAHWQLGDRDKARTWYDKAVQWMDKNQPNDAELRTFREEAKELLGLKEMKE